MYIYYWLLNIPWKNIELGRDSLALDSLPCLRVFFCFQTCLQMVVCFLRCSPVPTSHTIQVKLSLRMYEQTTRKQQHSSILLFSQKCEWPVARKSSVCCSSSLFILDDSYVVRWKYWIFSFAGVCRAAASDTAAAALLGASVSAPHCHGSAEAAGGEGIEQPLLCWACQPLCSRNRRGETSNSSRPCTQALWYQLPGLG